MPRYCQHAELDTQGECRTNVVEEGRNAVTWGVFPGQEIAQSTIIEKESFLAWKVSGDHSRYDQAPNSCNRMRRSPCGRIGHPTMRQTPKKGSFWIGFEKKDGWSPLFTITIKLQMPYGRSSLTRANPCYNALR